ncbi:MAG: hypothetical protein WCH31_06030 [Actinomycetes bacterium]
MRLRPACAVAISLLVAAPATAAIVPGRGVGGATIGMSPAQARAALGAPRSSLHGTNDFGPWVEYRYPNVVVSFQSGTGATTITTGSRTERTGKGIGVGSTVAELTQRITGARCLTELDHRHCYVGRWMPGEIVTDFSIRGERIVQVTVGRVLD